ncbi:MAG: sensor histidine kinase [Clostridiales bacterium]|nr:MAG: sensor histidine kinase [Clostridiales bacterium]
MKLKYYLNDKLILLLIESILLVFIDVLIIASKINLQDFIIINLSYIVVHVLYHIFAYRKLKAYFDRLLGVWDKLEEKNLICEFIEKPNNKELELLYDILIESGLSLNNKIAETEKIKDEYREYIERVVHEIKLPISVIKLIADKNDTCDSRNIKEETDKIQGYVEQVLYYARSNYVQNDYFIIQTDLIAAVRNVIKKHKNQLIAKNIAINLKSEKIIVLTDGKWIEFILSQLLDNAIKYSDNRNPQIRIYSKVNKNIVNLYISNNGITIPAEDIDHVFNKGFTGQNGRNVQHSTGMGLYLVKHLAETLGHKVTVDTANNVTIFCISFKSLD